MSTRRLFGSFGLNGIAVAARGLSSIIALALITRIASEAVVASFGIAWGLLAIGLAIGQSGAAQSLVDRRRIHRGHRHAASALTLMMTGAFSIVLALSAPAIASTYTYEREVLEGIFLAACLCPIAALGAVDTAGMQRGLHFTQLAICQGLASLAASATAMMLAFQGQELLGLLCIQALVGPYLFLCARLLGYRMPLGRFRMQQIHELWKIGRHISLSAVTSVLAQQTPTLMVSQIAGVSSTSGFVIAARIIQLVSTQISAVFNAVLVPYLRRVSWSGAAVRSGYLSSSRLLIPSVYLPLTLLITAPAETLEIVSGPTWISSADVLAFLAVAQLIIGLGHGAFSTFRAIGSPEAAWQFNAKLIAAQMLCLALASGLDLSLEWAAIALCVASTTMLHPVNLLLRRLEIPRGVFLRSLAPTFTAAAGAILSGEIIAAFSSADAELLTRVLWRAAVPALVFALLFASTLPELRGAMFTYMRGRKGGSS